MRKSSEESYRYLAVNPRDHAWGLCVTAAGDQPAATGSAGVPQRRHPPGHFYAWDAGRVLNEYALVFVTHGRGEFDSQAMGLTTRGRRCPDPVSRRVAPVSARETVTTG